MYTAEVYDALQLSALDIDDFATTLAPKIKESRRLIVAGNGGSSAIASHLVADVMKTTGRFDMPSVINLTDNVPLLTAFSNDVAYVDALSEMAYRHGVGDDDVVLIISSSGNSQNVVNLAHMTLSRAAPTYAMVGFDGGRLKNLLTDEYVLHIKSNDYGIVEDLHHIAMHALMNALKMV